MATKQVLIVEDDRNIAELLEIHLKDLSCEVTTASDGRTGLRLAKANKYDLVILDVMLPEMDGLDVCRELRKERRTTPILMLTARSEELDKVLGLESGADDYLTKPFAIREFIARAKAIFRRVEAVKEESAAAADAGVFVRGGVTIDRELRRVSVDGNKVVLTRKEFELLLLFAMHPGKTFTREQLLDMVWGYQYKGYDHTVNSHINRLRTKIEIDPTQPRYILTTWGVGYRFAEEADLMIERR